MVHKPKHKVHSFRGLLGNGGEDEINLERSNVNLAYRIVKLQIMPNTPGDASVDNVLTVWRESGYSQGASGAILDFTLPDLLAAGWLSANTTDFSSDMITIFDNTLFSRNIYVTQTDNDGADSLNYYIELEEVPVNASTLMQLKLGVARKLNLQQD
jgi:hypothetical protein